MVVHPMNSSLTDAIVSYILIDGLENFVLVQVDRQYANYDNAYFSTNQKVNIFFIYF